MCLQVDKRFKTRQEARNYKPLIAKKDIKVYKYLDFEDDVYISLFMGFKYEKGYHYSANISRNIFKRRHLNVWTIECNRGLHAYTNKMNKAYFEEIIMYIPKGSEYYLGTNGDIVSNNLIWY